MMNRENGQTTRIDNPQFDNFATSDTTTTSLSLTLLSLLLKLFIPCRRHHFRRPDNQLTAIADRRIADFAAALRPPSRVVFNSTLVSPSMSTSKTYSFNSIGIREPILIFTGSTLLGSD